MRVAVHFPAGHPLARGDGPGVEPNEGPSVAAYNLGRIEDGVHNAPIGHEPVPFDEFVQRLIERAQTEYPDAEVRLERLIDNGDGTSRWIPAEEFDPEQHTPVGPGQQIKRDLEVRTDQAGAA